MGDEDEFDYVEYEIEWENGRPVSCKLAGEGLQAEPMPPHPVVFQRLPTEQPIHPRELTRIERAIQRAFRQFRS